jgi:hypothetical protein
MAGGVSPPPRGVPGWLGLPWPPRCPERRHSSLVLSGRPTFTTWTGRSPAARRTWSATVDPFSRRDQRERRDDPITSWQAPAWCAPRISPEAVSPALTSTKVPCSSPSSRRSCSSRAPAGRPRLSIARTCTPWSLASDSPARQAAYRMSRSSAGDPSRPTTMTEACTGSLTSRAARNAVTGSGTESSS